jgi:hypothetical protein
MDVVSPNSLFSDSPKLGRDHPWFGALISSIDERLRWHHGVHEFTRSPDCIFRIEIRRCPRVFTREGDTRLKPGARIICLHLWNEQIPPVPKRGPTLGWARRMGRAMDVSLCELAQFLATRKDLDDVSAIFANLSLASADRRGQIARIMRRYGFETVDTPNSQTLSERLHRFGENVLIALMVFARNAVSLRRDCLWRDRVLMCLSRRTLQQCYQYDR